MFNHGDVFGNYQIVREIGRGGMGVVYEAEHLSLRKRVALKILLPERALDTITVQRFLREGEAASRIRHDNVVDVIDVGMHDGVGYLVMELLEGESLAERLERDIRLGARELADLMLPLADALAAAHEAGVVHRDLKPENVFLSRTRRGRCVPKLVDFGISRIERADDPDLARLTSSTVLVGTPCYMAPEAARGAHNVNALSDQYALGVVLYECVTGQLPFERASLFEVISAILTERPTDPGALVPALDARMEAVIQRAMARSPEARFPDMRSLGAALLPIASEAARAQWSAEFVGANTGPTSNPDPIVAPTFVFASTEPPPGAVTLDDLSAPAPSLPPVAAPASEPPASVSSVPPSLRPPPPRSATSLARSSRAVIGGGALAAIGLLALGAHLASRVHIGPAPRAAHPSQNIPPPAPILPPPAAPSPPAETPLPTAPRQPSVPPPQVAAAPHNAARETRVARVRPGPSAAQAGQRERPTANPSPEVTAPPRTTAQTLLREDFDPSPH